MAEGRFRSDVREFERRRRKTAPWKPTQPVAPGGRVMAPTKSSATKTRDKVGVGGVKRWQGRTRRAGEEGSPGGGSVMVEEAGVFSPGGDFVEEKREGSGVEGEGEGEGEVEVDLEGATAPLPSLGSFQFDLVEEEGDSEEEGVGELKSGVEGEEEEWEKEQQGLRRGESVRTLHSLLSGGMSGGEGGVEGGVEGDRGTMERLEHLAAILSRDHGKDGDRKERGGEGGEGEGRGEVDGQTLIRRRLEDAFVGLSVAEMRDAAETAFQESIHHLGSIALGRGGMRLEESGRGVDLGRVVGEEFLKVVEGLKKMKTSDVHVPKKTFLEKRGFEGKVDEELQHSPAYQAQDAVLHAMSDWFRTVNDVLTAPKPQPFQSTSPKPPPPSSPRPPNTPRIRRPPLPLPTSPTTPSRISSPLPTPPPTSSPLPTPPSTTTPKPLYNPSLSKLTLRLLQAGKSDVAAAALMGHGVESRAALEAAVTASKLREAVAEPIEVYSQGLLPSQDSLLSTVNKFEKPTFVRITSRDPKSRDFFPSPTSSHTKSQRPPSPGRYSAIFSQGQMEGGPTLSLSPTTSQSPPPPTKTTTTTPPPLPVATTSSTPPPPLPTRSPKHTPTSIRLTTDAERLERISKLAQELREEEEQAGKGREPVKFTFKSLEEEQKKRKRERKEKVGKKSEVERGDWIVLNGGESVGTPKVVQTVKVDESIGERDSDGGEKPRSKPPPPPSPRSPHPTTPPPPPSRTPPAMLPRAHVSSDPFQGIGGADLVAAVKEHDHHHHHSRSSPSGSESSGGTFLTADLHEEDFEEEGRDGEGEGEGE